MLAEQATAPVINGFVKDVLCCSVCRLSGRGIEADHDQPLARTDCCCRREQARRTRGMSTQVIR